MDRQNTTPGLVNWMGYLAITVLLTLPAAVLTVRSGAWQEGLLLYTLSCLGAALVLLVSVLLMLLPRFAPWRKAIAGRALFALPGALLLLSVLGSRGDYPPIHDITTDTQDPPVFTAAEQQRGQGANTLEIDAQAIALQQQAYPDLQTMLSEMSIDEVFDRALQVAGDMGWVIYHQDRNAGVIEAVDTAGNSAYRSQYVTARF